MTCVCHTLRVELHLKLLVSARVSGNKGYKIQIMWISTEAEECGWAGGSAWHPCSVPEGKRLPNLLSSTSLLKSSRRPVSSTDWKQLPDWPGRPVAFALLFFFNQLPATWPQSYTVHLGWVQIDLPAICMRQSSHLAAIRLFTRLTHLQLYTSS